MAGDFILFMDDAAIYEFLHNPRGEVAQWVLGACGPIVARGARRRVPVDTGRLYDSVGWEHGSDTGGPFVKVYADFYDRFLEKPAKQIPRARRSLRSALRDIPKLL